MTTTYEPHRPLHGYAELVKAQLDNARSAVAQQSIVARYEAVTVPGVTKGDIARRKVGQPALRDPRPATLWDVVFGTLEAKDQPERGERLSALLEALSQQVDVLEREWAEQKAIATAYAEWAKENGAEAIGTVTDTQSLQMLVGMLDGQVRDLEARLDAVEAVELEVITEMAEVA